MAKQYTTVGLPIEWYERLSIIADHECRSPGLQVRELIKLGEQHYGLNKKSKTKKNNNES